jgi:hypothetical protein
MQFWQEILYLYYSNQMEIMLRDFNLILLVTLVQQVSLYFGQLLI